MRIQGLVRLSKDAEGKIFGERMVINMSVADSNRVKRNGNWIDESMFIDADYWVAATSTVINYLKKGQQVYIDGIIHQESWEKDGVKHYRHKIVVDELRLAGSKSEGGSSAPAGGSGAAAAPKASAAPASNPTPSNIPEVDIDDEIPF